MFSQLDNFLFWVSQDSCCSPLKAGADHSALVRICEPIAFMSIFPYAYRMIETFHINDDPNQIAIYAGMLITAFAFAEFSSSVLWGRISDRIGRKPVLICGLVGTALSMILFGFSNNLPLAIVARALGGLLNGNIGVLQTTVAELVTVKEHQPRAYSIMPFVWCLGSIIGPALGGALAQPAIAYPWLFDQDSIFGRYPFLLPNLVCVIILLFGISIGVLFLEETHADHKDGPDWGRKLGSALIRKILPEDLTEGKGRIALPDTDENIEEPLPGYRTIENSPRLSSVTPSSVSSVSTPGTIESQESRKEGWNVVSVLNRQVVLVIVGYGILA